jgi:hypothetical protein
VLSIFDEVGGVAATQRASYAFDDMFWSVYGRTERPYVPRRPVALAARLTGSAIRRPFASQSVSRL